MRSAGGTGRLAGGGAVFGKATGFLPVAARSASAAAERCRNSAIKIRSLLDQSSRVFHSSE